MSRLYVHVVETVAAEPVERLGNGIDRRPGAPQSLYDPPRRERPAYLRLRESAPVFVLDPVYGVFDL